MIQTVILPSSRFDPEEIMNEKDSMNPFYSLAPFIQEFIYTRSWQELRPIQTAACKVINETDNNLLLTAGTASGKTEAAFFPILSELYRKPSCSVGVLYIAPLKALINDQFERITELCEEGGIAVRHWHGDVAQSKKDKTVNNPSGVLQITPESLQALLMHRHNYILKMFGDLRYVIIDEMHAFMRNDRGRQVLALLEQIQRMTDNIPRRVGLSATVGDYENACEWLSSGTGRTTVAPRIKASGGRWRISMEHFNIDAPALHDNENTEESEGSDAPEGGDAGYSYVFKNCTSNRGSSKSLIFCNSREEAEVVCATLRRYCDALKMPDRFLIHHGNLSAAIREDAEEKMKDESLPFHTVTTATLELGIDIGKLERAFQIDAPATVSSFLQRMGRTGRRDMPPEMRFVFREEPPEDRAPLPQLIPWQLIQGIAVVTLFTEDRFVEPAREIKYPFSMLYHQTMSILSYTGELLPSELADRVLSLSIFRHISMEDYAEVLRNLVSIGHIDMTAENRLIVGIKAEKTVNNYKFYATFKENEEFSVHSGSEELGTVVAPPPVGERLAIAGRVWDIKEVDIRKKQVFVTPVKGVVPAFFGLCPGDIHTRVLEKMKEVLSSDKEYAFLRPSAKNRLDEARHIERKSGLCTFPIVSLGGDSWCVFPWLGTYSFMTLERVLKIRLGAQAGIKSVESSKPYFIMFKCKKTLNEIFFMLREALREDFPPEALIYPKEEPVFDKFDEFIPNNLICKHFANDVLNLDETRERVLNWE